jgi:dienelactone hydrolase
LNRQSIELQRERRAELYRLLGKLPAREGAVQAELLSRTELAYGQLEKLSLTLNDEEPVPAYYIKPHGAEGKLPLVIYNHSHGGYYKVGKDEVLQGAPYLQQPPYAEALCRAGYAVLCIDHWAFGERSTRKESHIFKDLLWRGRVMWGMMVFDSLRALDYAAARPDVDANRIATLGMSMGSTMSWWLAALDERIRATVDLCCLSDYDALRETGDMDGHNLYYFVPDLLNHFSSADINALIVPRAHLSLAGERDRFTPKAGLDRIDRQLREAYAAAGAETRWQLSSYPEAGHEEVPGMREEAIAFLRKWV